MISGFRRELEENSSLLGYYVASSGNFLPTFRDNVSLQSSGAKRRPIGCPETSERNYYYCMRNNQEKRCSRNLRWRAINVKCAKGKGKGKVQLRTGHYGPEGE